ncbi:MAG: hypothetical protein ACYCU7_18325 [Acidimicrobiales bacterium]
MSTAALHHHHVDGRLGPGRRYIAPNLVVPLPPVHHGLLHLVLADLGLQWPMVGESILLHRARRHAVIAGWAADSGLPLTFDPAACRALQAVWLDVVGELEGGRHD